MDAYELDIVDRLNLDKSKT